MLFQFEILESEKDAEEASEKEAKRLKDKATEDGRIEREKVDAQGAAIAGAINPAAGGYVGNVGFQRWLASRRAIGVLRFDAGRTHRSGYLSNFRCQGRCQLHCDHGVVHNPPVEYRFFANMYLAGTSPEFPRKLIY